MTNLQPHRPRHTPEYADVCLRAISAAGLDAVITIGGGLGLLHYLDYRSTFDVDAWWSPTASPAARRQLVEVVEAALQTLGAVHRREWGEVVSVELHAGGARVFSFQIAERSAQLRAAESVAWTSVPVDSLDDLVASKMTALTERGAPRDFRDIHALCEADLSTPTACWRAWAARQELSGSDRDLQRARLAIETHLARIERHRPLAEIPDADERAAASALRTWFKEVFLHADLD